MNKLTTSWRTSAAGLASILAAIANAAAALLDADPLTVPDWGLVAAAIIAGVGLLSARDNQVTSEMAKGLPELQKHTDADDNK